MLVSGDPLPVSLPFHFYTNNQAIRQDTNPNISPLRQNRLTRHGPKSCIHNRVGNDHNKEISLCCITLTLQWALWLSYVYNRQTDTCQHWPHQPRFIIFYNCYISSNQITGKSFTCWYGTVLFANSNTLSISSTVPFSDNIFTYKSPEKGKK